MPISRLTIDLPKADHKRLKMAASLMGVTMKDLVIMSVDEFIHKKPNKLTEKAIKQSEKGKGIKKFISLQDLLRTLESDAYPNQNNTIQKRRQTIREARQKHVQAKDDNDKTG